MLLSDMGVEVFTIERPGVADPSRQFPLLLRALREDIAVGLVNKSRADCGDLFDMAGVFWGMLYSLVKMPVETLEDSHARASQLLRSIAHDSGKSETFLLQPLKLDGFEFEISSLPPEIGVDNKGAFAGGSD